MADTLDVTWGTQTSWRNGPAGTSRNARKTNAKSCTDNPRVSTGWEATGWGAALQIRTLLNPASHCDLMGMKAKHIPSCISRNVGSRLSKVFIPLYSGLVKTHLEQGVLFQALIRSKEKVLQWWQLSTGTSCPQKLWHLHPWRYSKCNWTRR